MKIDYYTWEKGQMEERAWHDQIKSYEYGFQHYKEGYPTLFGYVGLDTDLGGKSVIEIGSADFPVLKYCTNLGSCYIIEPMQSPYLERDLDSHIVLIKDIAEEVQFPYVHEIWMFNLLQHVLDPDLIIKKSKKAANVIRFFEPVNCPTSNVHFHVFDLDYFRCHFGECVQFYEKHPKAVNFHTWECAYGVWRK